MTADAPDELDRTFREEFGQAVATLVRVFGDLDIAEDIAEDEDREAFTIAARTWPTSGTPPNPGGWITTTVRRRAIDRLRREGQRDERQTEAVGLHGQGLAAGRRPLPDRGVHQRAVQSPRPARPPRRLGGLPGRPDPRRRERGKHYTSICNAGPSEFLAPTAAA